MRLEMTHLETRAANYDGLLWHRLDLLGIEAESSF